jgi:riboflavin kinase/FMN adenylyltransferase
MKIVQGWRDIEPDLRGACLALADFDGVHDAHRRLIAEAARAARRLGAPLGAAIFDPGPRLQIAPNAPPDRLATAGQCARVLEALGVDILYHLAFDDELARMTAECFSREVMSRGLGARGVAIGASFGLVFGERLAALPQFTSVHGCPASIVAGADDVELSEAARAALRSGRPECAAEILGRPFAIEGVVVEGRKLGRQLGFPTANVQAGAYVRPRLGVYATRSRLADGREIPGVANFGVNPTTGLVEARLEVWLFDFDEDLYGQVLETDLIAFLRPELKFDGVQTLIRQIEMDADAARTVLFSSPSSNDLGFASERRARV